MPEDAKKKKKNLLIYERLEDTDKIKKKKKSNFYISMLIYPNENKCTIR